MTYNALLAASESLPVVDIDNTIFIQAILFLVLFVVLQSLLFKPWLEVKARRAAKIGGAIEDAKSFRSAADSAATDYETRLSKARDAAMSLRSERRRDAEGEEATIVGAARTEASTGLEARKLVLSQEADKARGELSGRVAPLADEIVVKILGRSA